METSSIARHRSGRHTCDPDAVWYPGHHRGPRGHHASGSDSDALVDGCGDPNMRVGTDGHAPCEVGTWANARMIAKDIVMIDCGGGVHDRVDPYHGVDADHDARTHLAASTDVASSKERCRRMHNGLRRQPCLDGTLVCVCADHVVADAHDEGGGTQLIAPSEFRSQITQDVHATPMYAVRCGAIDLQEAGRSPPAGLERFDEYMRVVPGTDNDERRPAVVDHSQSIVRDRAPAAWPLQVGRGTVTLAQTRVRLRSGRRRLR